MYKRWLLILALVLIIRIQVSNGQSSDPAPLVGELYVPMQFDFSVDSALYVNPFDPADIDLIGIFQSPTGQQYIVPGFWMQPYVNKCERPCTGFDLEPEGEPQWQVRFTPQEVGDWSYTLQLRDNASLVTAEDGQFSVAESQERGFIHLGANGRYFQYANGQPYLPVGHNLKWSFDDIGGLDTYDRWLRELSEAGGNYARLFIDVPWFINLEWSGAAGDYREAQEAAAMLDIIMAQAAEYGVNLQLVLLWHQGFRTYNGPPVIVPDDVPRPDTSTDWDDNPYNILNGGILSGSSVFFFDEDAENLFRRRLRYIVSRWGASPQVFAWEIVDRIDRVSNFSPEVAGSWLQSSINYLRQIDQHGHLITASSLADTPVIAENPLLDFASAQLYQSQPIESIGEQGAVVVAQVGRYLEADYSPVLLVDYSLNPWFEPVADDPDGVHFQNTLWAALFSGASGGAMSDWWDTYVIPQNLTQYYAPLAAFAAGVDWATLNLQPAQASLLTDDPGENYLPVRMTDFRRQFAARPEQVVTHTITADGVFPGIETVPSFLYGQVFNTQFSQAQRYRVALPIDTYLEIGIESVSTQADARLVVMVDDVLATELVLRAGNRDVAVRVPLLAGEHSIVIDNLGEDWLELAYIEVGDLIAPARVLTLRDADTGVALAWVQHRGYTWDNVREGSEREPLQFRYRLDGLPPGRYVAELWDPLRGGVVGEEILRVADDGILAFDLLPIDRQLAIRAIRQPEPEQAAPGAATPATPTTTPAITPVASPANTSTPVPTHTAVPSATNTPPAIESRTTASPLPTLLPFVASTNTPRPILSPVNSN